MDNLRRRAFRTLKWTAKKSFEIGDQIHNGWVIANSTGDVRI